MKNQAQFHPSQYLKALLEQIVQKGGRIFEDTVALDIKKEKGLKSLQNPTRH